MNSSELSASIAHLDSMLSRVEKVIGRERKPKPLRPDVSYPRRRKVVVPHVTGSRLEPKFNYKAQPRSLGSGVATGQLTGNEMRMSSGYSQRPSNRDDCDPDGMWANFESEFDDMVAGMH